MPYLIQKKADGNVVKQWDVPFRPFVVGRGDQVDAQVEDSEMSRRHFVIAPQGNGCVLQDQNSTNGTLLNGQPVTKATLKPNDRIQAGKTLFVFVEGLGTVIRQLEVEDRHYSTFVQKMSDKDAH